MQNLIKLLLFVVCIFIFENIFGQNTTILKPGPSLGKDAFVTSYSGNQNSNFGGSQDIAAVSWTSSQIPFDSRSYFEFDLSQIPSNATVISASLNLFHNPNSGHSQGHQGNNGSILMRVTSPWTESTVSWNNQPSYSSNGQILLPNSSNSTQDYLGISVDAQIQDMISNPSQNFGFVLQLQNETIFRSIVFASSDHPDSLLRPELSISWTDSLSEDSVICVDLRSTSNDVEDAYVSDYPGGASSNFGSSQDIAAVAWTSGPSFISRSYFRFDISQIPVSSSIVSANLSLKANPNSGHSQGHQSSSGSNECLLRKVTSPWGENSITWNNQPSTTSIGQASIPQSTSPIQDYTNIDLKNLMQDAVNNPSTYYGFQMALASEIQFRSMVFASSDHQNSALHPQMRVCYLDQTTGTLQVSSPSQITVYPNPSNSVFKIKSNWEVGRALELEIRSLDGRLHYKKSFTSTDFLDGEILLNLEGSIPEGLYLLSICDDTPTVVSTLIILNSND